MKKFILTSALALIIIHIAMSQEKRLRDYGIEIGVLRPGQYNTISDVEGVLVGHRTLIKGQNIRTGVTAILPYGGNIFQRKVPAAIYIGNGYGKLAGYSQVEELGNLETPVILTNTLSVPKASDALISYSLGFAKNENIRSVNPVVGETNDGFLNDIRGRHVKEEDVLLAIENADSGPIAEGNVGAGTGTVCFGFKGGIGTASRVVPQESGAFTVGVLVQTNFGGVLEINGVPIAKELGNYAEAYKYKSDGSCMIIVATDAPLNSRNLKRLAKRAFMGLAKTGGIASNGSGDYVIAFSTSEANRIPALADEISTKGVFLRNEAMTPLFLAAIEATEEAILNSLFAAKTMSGYKGHTAKALPIEEVLTIMKKYNKIKEEK